MSRRKPSHAGVRHTFFASSEHLSVTTKLSRKTSRSGSGYLQNRVGHPNGGCPMNKYPHRHFSMDALQQQIREGITLQGFAIRHVLSSGKEPEYSYSVGLHVPGSIRPELFISGLSVHTRIAWLLELGFRIQGPPPLATR